MSTRQNFLMATVFALPLLLALALGLPSPAQSAAGANPCAGLSGEEGRACRDANFACVMADRLGTRRPPNCPVGTGPANSPTSRIAARACTGLSLEESIVCGEEQNERRNEEFQLRTPEGRAWLEAKWGLDDQGREYSASELLAALPEAIQEKIRNDANSVFSRYSAEFLVNRTYDLDCMAPKVLDAVVMRGPNTTQLSPEFFTAEGPVVECIDKVKISRIYSEQCEGNGFQRCACFGDAMADLVAAQGQTLRGGPIPGQMEAWGMCGGAESRP